MGVDLFEVVFPIYNIIIFQSKRNASNENLRKKNSYEQYFSIVNISKKFDFLI